MKTRAFDYGDFVAKSKGFARVVRDKVKNAARSTQRVTVHCAVDWSFRHGGNAVLTRGQDNAQPEELGEIAPHDAEDPKELAMPEDVHRTFVEAVNDIYSWADEDSHAAGILLDRPFLSVPSGTAPTSSVPPSGSAPPPVIPLAGSASPSSVPVAPTSGNSTKAKKKKKSKKKATNAPASTSGPALSAAATTPVTPPLGTASLPCSPPTSPSTRSPKRKKSKKKRAASPTATSSVADPLPTTSTTPNGTPLVPDVASDNAEATAPAPTLKKTRRSKSNLRTRNDRVADRVAEDKEDKAEAKLNPPPPDFDIVGKDPKPELRARLFTELVDVETYVNLANLNHESTAFKAVKHRLGKSFKGPCAGKVIGSDGSIGGAEKLHPDVNPKVAELLEKGYTYVQCGNKDSPPFGLVDREGLMYGARCKQPQDNGTYMANVEEMYRLANWVEDNIEWDPVFEDHDRGPFGCANIGISHNRNPTPGEFKIPHNNHNRKLFETFAESPAVQAIVKHIVVCLDTWFPRLARLYTLNQRRVAAKDSLVNAFFPGCPFAAASLNLAEQVIAISHLDNQNLVFGVCAIFALGCFNPQTSAQLVLEEPRLIIELGPGDLIFFPSATIHHWNMPMASHEKRKSFIMYSAGGLFRWVKQGHKTQAAGGGVAKTAAQRRKAAQEGAARWSAGWKMFSNIAEFKAMAA
ncbi:hypothetical protein EIP91_003853 [Steccherinum ochraceum]|uniref:Uncharacterized protein n=1 Tax=Steccherinum ochraceum TaxID=92696 RepID=A0A4R0RI96_9APHY|nr:hypothetical protein EIP91_003853 [Steccherinum ochraceum]